MTSPRAQPATNERILHLLEEVKAQLADSMERQQQIAKDLTRLVNQQVTAQSCSGRLSGWLGG